MPRRKRGSGSVVEEGRGFSVRFGPRGRQVYESGFRTRFEAEARLTVLQAAARRMRKLPAPLRLFPKRAKCVAFKNARQDNGCESCGWLPPPPLTATALHVHHIVQQKDDGDSSDANLLLLCPNHHALAHAICRLSPGLMTREAVLSALQRAESPPERSTG